MTNNIQVKNLEAASSSPVRDDSQAARSPSDKCHQCESLIEELRVSKSQCEDLQRLQHQLEEQVTVLEAKLQQSQIQEKDLNNEIRLLQEKLNETHITNRKLDICVPSTTDTNIVPDFPLVNTVLEQAEVPMFDGSETRANASSMTRTQEMLEQCQCKLKELERENKLLQVCMPQFCFHTTIMTKVWQSHHSHLLQRTLCAFFYLKGCILFSPPLSTPFLQ